MHGAHIDSLDDPLGYFVLMEGMRVKLPFTEVGVSHCPISDETWILDLHAQARG